MSRPKPRPTKMQFRGIGDGPPEKSDPPEERQKQFAGTVMVARPGRPCRWIGGRGISRPLEWRRSRSGSSDEAFEAMTVRPFVARGKLGWRVGGVL